MSELFTHSPFADTIHAQTNTADGEKPPLVPPPPAESIDVSLRTMASDLDMMAKQGGTPGAIQAIQSIAMARSERMTMGPPPAPSTRSGDTFRSFAWIMLGGLGMVLLFAIGYSVIPLFLPETPSPSAKPSSNSSTTPVLPPAAPVILSHTSLFGVPADERMSLSIGTGSPQTLANQIFGVLQSASPGSSLIEVELKDAEGSAITWPRFLELAGGAGAVPDEFWNGRFEPDFTLFARRTGPGFVIGYALKLKSGVSPLVLRQDLVQLENKKPLLKALFLVPVPDWTGGFEDAQLTGQPIRLLSTGTSTPQMVYGLPYNRFWVIAGSQDAFRDALPRLGGGL